MDTCLGSLPSNPDTVPCPAPYLAGPRRGNFTVHGNKLVTKSSGICTEKKSRKRQLPGSCCLNIIGFYHFAGNEQHWINIKAYFTLIGLIMACNS